MRNESFLRCAAAALIAAGLLAGCALQPPAAAVPATVTTAPAPPMRTMALPEPASSAAAPSAPAAPNSTSAAPRELPPTEAVLAYADRLRSLPAGELTQEIQRLGNTTYTPMRAMQLALALGQSRTVPNVSRAQSLLQRVLAQPDGEAAPLHPLARLLAGQLAEQRRADEQAERQGQQLREAQRRIDQLNERLEALRAIERSLPSRPSHDVQPPRSHTPRPNAP